MMPDNEISGVNNATDVEKLRTRESRPAAPRMPVVVPDYNLGKRHTEAVDAYFDAEGRPRVASAREVAPPEDNPLSIPVRIGSWVAYHSINGPKLWPLNVRTNPLLFYLTGRIAPGVWDDLFTIGLWAILAAVDIWSLRILWDTGGSVIAWIPILLATFPLLPLVAIPATLLLTTRHIRRTEGHVPFDELLVTRMSPDEIIYGMMIRPLGLLHLLNILGGTVIGIGGIISVCYSLIYESITYNVIFYDGVGIAIGASFLYLLRMVLGFLCINHTAAVCLRSRFMTPRLTDALRKAAKESLRVLVLVLLLEALLVLLVVFVGMGFFGCLALLLLPLAFLYVAKYLIALNGLAAGMLQDVAKNYRKWYMLADEDARPDERFKLHG